MAIFYRVLSVFLLVILLPVSAQAKDSGWVSSDYVQGKLMSTVEGTGDEEIIDVLLHLRLNKDWHTYWRTSGDAGLPPVFTWDGSTNIDSVTVLYPAPKRYDEVGLQVFGYDGDVMFPLQVKVKTPGEAVSLALSIDMLVCHDICVPEHLALGLEIPSGAAVQSKSAPMMSFAMRKVPEEENAGMRVEGVIAGPEGLVVTAFSQRGYDRADVFVEVDGLVISAIPDFIIDPEEQRKAMIKIPKPFGVEDLATALEGKTLTVTLTDGTGAVSKSFPF